MPKSRRGKPGKKSRVTKVAITERTREILENQRQRFREKFGRDPGPSDPVFFEPDATEPVPMSAVKVEAETIEAMRKAGTPPQFIYAYKRTGGLLLMENMREHWPPDRVKEWDDAIDQYFAIEEASKQPDRPSAAEWNTSIPELLASPFTRQDLAKVHACLRAVEPIEAQGMTLITRIELAAIFLASALSHGYTSGDETGGSGPNVFALAGELVVRRAREIYAQDSA
ncbi:MAG TPA: hypothetical protein VH519_06940 [Hyphomicrobiaceae bacterium]|jgi:hypothetical protein